MARILTITLSPVVDKSTTVPKFVPEQKLQCSAPVWEAGGGGVNVSRALKRLGTDSIAFFPSGGTSGAMLEYLLKNEKVGFDALRIKNSTRENFIVVESISNRQYRFGMPGTEIQPIEEKQIIIAIEKLSSGMDYIVASGSIPPGIDSDFYARIAHLSKKSGIRFIADTSGEALTEAVETGVYLLKPNLRELSLLSGKETLKKDLIDDAARSLISKGRCEVIVVSMGEKGAYLVTSSLSEHVRAPKVEKLSTVGAGDCMVGGMVHALVKGKDLREMLRMGIACGTAATMNPGTELFKRKDAENLHNILMKDYK